MVSLWDFTVQHPGWRTSDFATSGWNDLWAPIATGLAGGSVRIEVLNGQRTDVSLRYEDPRYPSQLPQWINVNTAGVVGAAAVPGDLVVTPDTRVLTFTRSMTATTPILVRYTISESAVTPPPSTPP
jgi:hypothetical protein